jgi:hypothetical protein
MSPGLKFFADRIDPLYPETGLYPTMSTYQFGFDLEGGPVKNELYVVCKDGTIQSVYEPERPIGWELIEDGDEWFYRVTQMNHPRKRCAVRFQGRTDAPPAGRGSIGSTVVVCRRVEEPQNAEISEPGDDGEAEVTSVCSANTIALPKLRPPPAGADMLEIKEFISDLHDVVDSVNDATFVGTGVFETIARNLNPQLAACAVIADDPVQTAALAKFAEGKMSYAEMRGLCG